MEIIDSLANPGWSPRVNDVVAPPVRPVGPITPPIINSPKKGLAVRAEGDNVYLISNGKKHWFSSAEAFSRMGFKFGDEVKMDQVSLDVFPEGEPIK